MKRDWNTLKSGPDEESAEIATALAQIASGEELRSLLDILVALDRFGGEAYIGSYRQKFNADGERVEPDAVGDWETVGYVFHYEHVAKRTRAKTATPEEAEESVSLAQARPIEEVPELVAANIEPNGDEAA